MERENWQLKEENSRAQLALLKAQINPHFLYNALSALMGMIRKNQQSQSISFIENLSNYFRYTLTPNKENLVKIEEEIQFLQVYSFLLKERFGENLQITIDLPYKVLTKKIPSMSLQLLVENAVKHNQISSNFPLKITIREEEKYIVVNNPLQAHTVPVNSTGIGLNNLIQRYVLLGLGQVIVEQNELAFIVKLPILEV